MAYSGIILSVYSAATVAAADAIVCS